MVDRNPEVVADCVDQLVGVGGVESGVDPAPPTTVDTHVQVALKGERGDLSRFGVDPPHHDDVGPLSEVLAAEKEWRVGRIRVDTGVVIGAGEEEVAGFWLGETGIGFDRIDLLDPDRTSIDWCLIAGDAVVGLVCRIHPGWLIIGRTGVDNDELPLGERPPAGRQHCGRGETGEGPDDRGSDGEALCPRPPR